MKRTYWTGLALSSMLLGFSAMAQPGDQKHGQSRQHGHQGEHFTPPQRHEPDRHHEAAQMPPGRSRHDAMEWQHRRGWADGNSWQAHNHWNEMRVHDWAREHRNWVARGGYGGYYIPRDRFAASFGPRHWFRIRSRPVFYQGYPRFAYGGFSFLIVDPWPDYWPENWYAADDVYVDYDNGYYLHNRRDPGVRIAISVVL